MMPMLARTSWALLHGKCAFVGHSIVLGVRASLGMHEHSVAGATRRRNQLKAAPQGRG